MSSGVCLCNSLSAQQPKAAAASVEQRVERYPETTIFWVRVDLYTGTEVTTRIQMIIDVKLNGSLFARRGTNKKPIVSEGQYLTKLFSLTD